MNVRDKTKFRKWCTENGLTARKIEEETGIKKRTVNSWFSGERSPSAPSRKKLREKLKIDTSQLFD